LVLRWEAVPGAKEYVLEIAEDRRFERVVAKKRVPNAAYRFVPPSSEVSYFFRVAAVDNLGRPGRFSRAMPIQQVLPTPKPAGPADGAVVDHVGPPPTVTLRWKAVVDAAEYRVEIASERDFADATPKKVSTTALTWHPPELGTFYWRVAAVDKTGLPGRTSATRAFRVRTGPPQLRSPRPRAMVAFEPPTTKVALHWTSGPAQGFDIQVATGASFRRPRKLTSKTDTTTIEIDEPRKWHWRVRAVDPKGKAGPWSTPAAFVLRAASIALDSPAEDATIVTSEPTTAVTFAWTAVADAKSYALTLVTAEGEEERIDTSEPSATAKLLAESHTWSVAAYDRRRRLTAFSAERRVTVLRRLLAPQLVAPEQDSIVLLLAPGTPEVELTWQPVTGASAYQVEVADTTAFESPEQKDAAAEHATLSIARPGDTFWRVRAVDGEWSEPRKLLITPRGDGSYVATWSGGNDGGTLSATGPFDLHASTNVTVDKATLFAGAKVGVLTNFTADASPRFHIQGVYRLPWLERRLFATAAIGYAYSGKSFNDVVEVAANLHRVPITLGAGYRHELAWLELYGTFGLALDPFVGTVSVDGTPFDNEPGLVFGVDVAGGASYDLGPGQLFAELALRATSSWDGLFSLGGAGMAIAVGYSLAVF